MPHAIVLLLTALTLTAVEAPVYGDPRFPLQSIRDISTQGRYRPGPPPNATVDPVAPLADGDVALITGRFDARAQTAFIARYIDRIEAQAADQAGPELIAWLATRPDFRKDFWLALSWAYDDIAAACRILDDLRELDEARTERFRHLAIAFAVVHDTPSALLSSRYYTVHGVADAQYRPLSDHRELFLYFTDPKNMALFPFKPHQMSWSMMVHLVDLDADAAQRTWALQAQRARSSDISGLYQLVKYDNAKLSSGGTSSALGSLPYTLENLLARGGICGDQSHFTSGIAKIFGIPAMKCSGYGRFGGMGHAWAGFLTAKGRRPVLDFTGRFFFDYFYTGNIFDPQTRTQTMDRYVALAYDGASLSFPKFQDAQALMRAAQACFDSEPQASLALAKAAIDLNTYCADAWRVLMTHIAVGAMPRKEAATWGSRMLKDLKDHPDLTIECIDLYLRSIPLEDQSERQRLWNGAYALYAQRSDLQIALRLKQCRELVAVDNAQLAIQRALEAIVPNAKEGSLVLPLVELVVTTTNDQVAQQPAFPVARIRAGLAQADGDFPKMRGREPSAAYTQFRALLDKL